MRRSARCATCCAPSGARGTKRRCSDDRRRQVPQTKRDPVPDFSLAWARSEAQVARDSRVLVRLSVVIVTWNRSALLAECLASLERTQPERPEVVVVDNGSSDGTGELLASRFPWVDAIALERNAGFAHANNLGVAAAHGDVVVLLNDDTVVLESFAPLLARFAHPGVGAVGPRLVGPEGEEQR